MLRILLIACVWFVLSSLVGQRKEAIVPIPNRLIVQWNPGSTPANHGAHKTQNLEVGGSIQLLVFATEDAWWQADQLLRKDSRVKALQYDYPIEFRNDPNDPRFPEQQNLLRTGFPEVWREATGGTTSNGDQVVIAVLDSGFDLDHEDIAPSLWTNQGEIIGDGIDNDGNGYIDDKHGWNFRVGNNSFESVQHGTQVIGMLGAKGDNGLGITGTGWGNQLMTFSIDEVSDIIAAYAYVVDQRRRWQNSNGREGALVVATNASFGLEGRFCEEFPIWEDMFEQLGQLGVLTAASTANRSWDVDDFGDMPTTCPTEFVIGVTNLGPDDRLWRGSAWGRESIDLAAPGQGSYTTWVDDRYGSFASTSAAAPYVTGAIALLYSLPCERIQKLLKDDPVSAARLVRRALLQSASTNDALFNLTATEGNLDVAAAWQRLKQDCAGAQTNQLSITRIYPNPASDQLQLEFSDPSLGPYTVELIDPLGRIGRRYELPMGSGFPVVNPLSVADLPRGIYQLRLSNGRETDSRALILR